MSDLSFWSLPDVAKKDFRVVVGIGKCIEQRIEVRVWMWNTLVWFDDARIKKKQILNFIRIRIVDFGATFSGKRYNV